MTHTDDTYNGWPNRETWATNLHLSNDQSLYITTTERVREALDNRPAGPGLDDWYSDPEEGPARRRARRIGDAANAIRDLVEGMFDGYDAELVGMRNDIGSTWRVDWQHIAEHWATDVADEDGTDLAAPFGDEDDDEDAEQ